MASSITHNADDTAKGPGDAVTGDVDIDIDIGFGDRGLCPPRSDAVLEPNGPVRGCGECLRIGSSWVHLRLCQTCGEIGCCDSSPHRHASAHARAGGHPVTRSIEPGEDWSWCYVDEVMFRVEPSGARFGRRSR